MRMGNAPSLSGPYDSDKPRTHGSGVGPTGGCGIQRVNEIILLAPAAAARFRIFDPPMNPLAAYLVIGLGSALGGVARYGCGVLAAALWPVAFPWMTILINILGSFVIGLFATLTGPDGRLLVGTLWRQFVMVGLCGGYTTFSAFNLESLALLRSGRPLAAGANVGLSLTLCLVAVWLGHRIARRLNQ
jgi:fluoride exporter